MNRSSRMNDSQHDNVTLTEYYEVYPDEDTSSIGYIQDGDRLALCKESYQILPIFSEYTNLSDILYPQEFRETGYASSIRISAFIVIIIIGLIGNTSIILNVALNKSLRTTINIYICNLAFADVMTCINAISAFYDIFSNDYVFGEISCKFFSFAFSSCLVSSVLTLSAITFDRFMAVKFPLHVRFTEQHKPFVVAIIWIVSMLVATPYIIINKIQTAEFKDFLERRCVPDWSNERYYHQSLGFCTVNSTLYYAQTLLLGVFLYFLPIIFMIIAYSIILWTLSKSKPPGELLEENVNFRKNRRVHRMVFVVLLVFFISWTPYEIALLYDATIVFDNEPPQWWSGFRWAAWSFYFGNSCINPIIYAGFKQDFRQGFSAIFRCGKPAVRPKPQQSKPHALGGANKPKPQEVHLEMELKFPAAEAC